MIYCGIIIGIHCCFILNATSSFAVCDLFGRKSLNSQPQEKSLHELFAEAPRELGREFLVSRTAIPSNNGTEPRHIYVLLPPGYSEDLHESYSVFYMQDGQNLGKECKAFGGKKRGWGLPEIAPKMIKDGEIEPIIIVGIPHIDRGRNREYFYSDHYLVYLTQKIKPFIDRTLRTKSKPENTGIAGSSLGALVAHEASVKYAHIFGRIGVMSGSFGAYMLPDDLKEKYLRHEWFEYEPTKEDYARLKARIVGPSNGQRLYLDVGSPDDSIDETFVAYTELLKKGWGLENLDYFHNKGAPHNEDAWRNRTPRMLRFLFPNKNEKVSHFESAGGMSYIQ